MPGTLRVAVADDSPDDLFFLAECLKSLGHQIVCEAQTGRALLDQIADTKPDVLLVDIRMPDMDGIEVAHELNQRFPLPVILVSGLHDDVTIRRAEEENVLVYLVKPVTAANLGPAIAIARRRFQEFQALLKESADLRRALEERKFIERAKGILMRRAGLAEDEAFGRLVKTARDGNHKLADVARMIVTADQLFQS